MKFSSKERIGLRAMIEFARHYGQGPTSLSEVSRVQGLPLPYLEQVVRSLRRSGLLRSSRGAHGGYALTREPATISVADIFRAVEGSLVPLECMRDDEHPCAMEESCQARSVWYKVTERLSDTLDSTSLADILL